MREKKILFVVSIHIFFHFNKVYIWPSTTNFRDQEFLLGFFPVFTQQHTQICISLPQLLIFLIMR